MQERYGAANPRRRLTIIVGTTILGVIFISWLAWAAWFHSSPDVDAAVTRYEISDDHTARVQVEATIRDEESGSICLLRATARDHTIVGELNLTVADLEANKGKWIPVRTERRATTVELVRCTEHGS